MKLPMTMVIESVGYTVRKTAMNEQGNCEQERYPVPYFFALSCEVDGCRHQYAATYCQRTLAPRTESETGREQRLGVLAERHARATGKQTDEETADKVAAEDDKQRQKVAFRLDEAGCAGEEFEFVTDHGGETEDEENHTKFLTRKKAEARDTDTDTGEDGGAEYIEHFDRLLV